MAEAGWHIVEVPQAERLPRRGVRRGRRGDVPQRGGHHAPGCGLRGSRRSPTSRRWSRHLGCSINRIRPPGTLDGGDVLKVGDTVYVGEAGAGTQRRRRTPAARDSRAPGCQMHRRAGARSRRSLHLKSAVTALTRRHHHRLRPTRRRPGVLPPLRPRVPEESGAHVGRTWAAHKMLMAADCPGQRRSAVRSQSRLPTDDSSTSASSRSSRAASPVCRSVSSPREMTPSIGGHTPTPAGREIDEWEAWW